MKSFSESLRITKNLKMLEQNLILMSQNGISPSKFVEWYATDGIILQDQGKLSSASQQWLSDQLFLNEGLFDRLSQGWKRGIGTSQNSPMAAQAGEKAGNLVQGAGQAAGWLKNKISDMGNNFATGFNGPQQGSPATPPPLPTNPSAQTVTPPPVIPQANPTPPPVIPQPANPAQMAAKNANTAILDLHKRLGVSNTLREKLGGDQFTQMLLDLSQMLQDPKNLQAAPGPTTATPTESAKSNFIQSINEIRTRNEIHSYLVRLQEYGFEPMTFVKMYAEEGRFLKEGFGDWLTNMGQNAANWIGNKAQRASSWFGDKRAEKDQAAVGQAMQAVSTLERSLGSGASQELLQLLHKINQSLSNMGKAPVAQPQPQPAQGNVDPGELPPGYT